MKMHLWKWIYHILKKRAEPQADIRYVTVRIAINAGIRKSIANIGLFMQQYFRDALPISFSYAINGFTGG